MRERAAFVGREAELAALDAAWQRVASGGERRVFLLGGDPGAGKRRLAEHFARESGAVVHRGRCADPAGAFAPFVDALGTAPAAPPSSHDPRGARFRLFEAFAAAFDGPSVLVLEDLHEADPSTRALLAHVVRAPAPAPLLVVATYRRAELALDARRSATVEGLRRDGLLDRLFVGGLSEEDVVALGGDASLHRRSGGNPFHLQQLLRGDDGADGVRKLLARRLAALTPATRIALSGAAVLGQRFDATLAGLVAGQEEADLEEATRAGVVVDGGFEHDLVREVVLAELTPMRLAALHRRAFDVLSGAGAPPVVLARHALAAGGGEPAVTCAVEAAVSLVDALAFEAGAELYEAALEALGPWDPPRQADLLLALGDALSRAGDRRGAREAFAGAFRAAEGLEDTARRAEAALGFAGPRRAAPEFEEAALLEAALPSAEGAVRARLLARLAEAHYGEASLTDALSAEALDLARGSGDSSALAAAASARLWALWVPGRARERLLVAEDLESLRSGEALVWAVGARLELGDLSGVSADVARFAERADAAADPGHAHQLGVLRALEALLAARFSDAETLAAAAAADAPARSRADVVQLQAIQLLAIRAEQDRLHEARSAVSEYAEVFPAHAACWRAALALCDIRSGRIGDAHRVLTAVDDFPHDGMWVASLCVSAQACVEAGDEAVADHLLELLEPFAGEWSAFAWAASWGPVALWLGELAMLLGRWEDAARRLDSIDASGAPAWALRVRFARARLLGVEPPRGELDAIARRADALGMRHLGAQVAGARVAPPA